MRWRTTSDDEPGLFAAEDLLVPELGTGRMSGLEFLHVTAKRVLNRVPDGSRAPFRWTINVYRGCSHACVYCLAGPTPIAMADGSTRPIAELRRGDTIVGTTDGRLVATTVVDHWQTRRPAYRVRHDTGELIASGDHRFRTTTGWRRVDELAPGTELLAFPDAVVVDRGGTATTTSGKSVVRDVTDLASVRPMFDITTGTGDFVAGGVVSHNCFARPTHEYLGLNTGDDFDRRIVVKINAAEKVRAELADPRWTGEPVAMGTNTDPYQRAEAKYRLTRGVLEALADRGNPFSILTKSPLVTRDLDVLRRAATNAEVSVNFSIATLDQRVWRASEPGTPNPRRRIAAMAQLAEAGITTGALVAPILPGISDTPGLLREVVGAVDDAGGRLLGIGALHLGPGLRDHFFGWLRDAYPDQYAGYLRRYAASDHAPERYFEQLYAKAGVDRPGPNLYRG